MEEWKDIKGYEGLYMISSLGNEMSNKEIANKYKCSYGIISTRKHQIKKGLI